MSDEKVIKNKGPYADFETLETQTKIPSYFEDLVRFFTSID